jgi:hypothetical protein
MGLVGMDQWKIMKCHQDTFRGLSVLVITGLHLHSKTLFNDFRVSNIDKMHWMFGSEGLKWYGLGEDKLVELFPCFSLLVQKYNDKMCGKRSKWERDLIKDGKVESKAARA